MSLAQSIAAYAVHDNMTLGSLEHELIAAFEDRDHAVTDMYADQEWETVDRTFYLLIACALGWTLDRWAVHDDVVFKMERHNGQWRWVHRRDSVTTVLMPGHPGLIEVQKVRP